MGAQNTHAEVRFPLAGLVGWTVVPMVGVGMLACAIALVRGDTAIIEAEALALITVMLGAIAGGLVLAQAGPRSVGAWSSVVLIAQGVRMFASLGLGLVAFFLAQPSPFAFWMLFLAASLAFLAGEVAFVLKWIRSAPTAALREEAR